MENNEMTTESGIILDRRQILGGASAVGLAAMLGAGSAQAAETPKKGGTSCRPRPVVSG